MSSHTGHHGLPAYVVGLTGNIATGKSSVAHLLVELGARAIDADKVAHALMAPGTPVHDEIVRAYGPGIVSSEGGIDRAALGRIVFSDSAQLERLEAIVHPAVVRRVDEMIAEIAGEHRLPVIVVEAIKLVESGMYRRYDALWMTTCARATQLERLMARNRFTREEAALRIDSQPPQSAKVALADEVIENDGTWRDLAVRVQAAWGRIPSRFLDKCS